MQSVLKRIPFHTGFEDYGEQTDSRGIYLSKGESQTDRRPTDPILIVKEIDRFFLRNSAG